jgi:hypothetical protein
MPPEKVCDNVSGLDIFTKKEFGMRGKFLQLLVLTLVFAYFGNVAVAEDSDSDSSGTTTTNSNSQTAQKKKKKQLASRKLASTQTTDGATTTDTMMSPSAAKFRAYIGPGIFVGGGTAGFAMNFGGAAHVTNMPLYVGADLGLDFIGDATIIQLLPTAYYMFTLPKLRHTRLYGGLSLGPAIATAGGFAGQVGNAQVNVGGSTTVLFEMLIRPGAEFDLAPNLMVQVEPKFGLLSSSFVFIPQANAVYTF